jgi:glycosyltransferase involved in cell wall biosynthesis
LCRDLELADQVRFCGELDSVGLIALLDRVRWFLHPGRKPEAFGLAALEAMARGVPCLVSTPGGMREYLYHGKNGWEIAASEADLFAERMQAVLDDPARETDFRAHARATAAGFSRQRFEDAVNRFYDAALES